jgi:hypothetical protein
MSRSWIITFAVALVLFMPVYVAGDLLGWSPVVAGWWGLAVVGATTLLHAILAEREEEARRSGGRPRSHRSRG